MDEKYKKSFPDKVIIDKNVIKYNDVVIQINNISLIDIIAEPKKKILPYIIGTLVGVIMLIMGFSEWGSTFIVMGMIVACVFGALLYWRTEDDENRDRYLFMFTNSSYMYGLMSENQKFLCNIKDQIEYCMNNRYEDTISIDLKNCTITNSPIIAGNSNEVKNGQ